MTKVPNVKVSVVMKTGFEENRQRFKEKDSERNGCADTCICV